MLFISFIFRIIRIPWNTKVESYSQAYRGKGEIDGAGINGSEIEAEGSDGEEDEEEAENEQPPGADGYTLQQMQLHAQMVTEESGEEESAKDNTCQLLWQGILAKRCFTGFKFQVLQLFYCIWHRFLSPSHVT